MDDDQIQKGTDDEMDEEDGLEGDEEENDADVATDDVADDSDDADANEEEEIA